MSDPGHARANPEPKKLGGPHAVESHLDPRRGDGHHPIDARHPRPAIQISSQMYVLCRTIQSPAYRLLAPP